MDRKRELLETPDVEQRLSSLIDWTREHISVGTPSHRVAPTLASWYNAGFDGGAVTVEFTSSPTHRWTTVVAGHGILKANLAAW